MTEDQVIGSIRALNWVLVHFSLGQKQRLKIHAELDGLEYRLKQMRGEIPKPVPPVTAPTSEELAARAEREHKRIALEAKIESAKLMENACVKSASPAPIVKLESPPRPINLSNSPIVVSPIVVATLATKRDKFDDAYNEPSDFRPLPHFRGRDEN